MDKLIYWVQYWATLHRNEMYIFSDNFTIHDDFLSNENFEDVLAAFKELHYIFYTIYDNIINQTESMNMPIYKLDDYNLFSNQARNASLSTYKYVDILCVLGYAGSFSDNSLFVDVEKFVESCKKVDSKLVTNSGKFIKKFEDYGFYIEGLSGERIPKTGQIRLSYYDNIHLIPLLKSVATKAYSCNRMRDFRRMHFKLLKDDLNTVEYGHDIDIVLDMIKDSDDRNTALTLHNELISRGYFFTLNNHGDQARYYHTESNAKNNTSSCFRIIATDIDCIDPNFTFMFRIKNIEKCIDYLYSSPNQIQNTFSFSDKGCGRKCGRLSYQFKGNTIFRCGCCSPNFRCKPQLDDIPYYLNCVEMCF